MGVFQELQFLPTSQKHTGRWTGKDKFALDVNERVIFCVCVCLIQAVFLTENELMD